MNTAKRIDPTATLEELAVMLGQLDDNAGSVVTGKVNALEQNIIGELDSVKTPVLLADVEGLAALDDLAALEQTNQPVVAPASRLPEQGSLLDVGDEVLSELESKNTGTKKPRAKKKVEPVVEAPVTPPLDALEEELGETVETMRRAAAAENKVVGVQPRSRFDLVGMNDADWLKVGLYTSSEDSVNLIRQCPVKVQDKALNVVQWMLRGQSLSIFTELCLKELVHRGSTTSAGFRGMLMSEPDKTYTLGTAGSQAGQMMKLFPVLGIATRIGTTLTINKESPIVKHYWKQRAAL